MVSNSNGCFCFFFSPDRNLPFHFLPPFLLPHAQCSSSSSPLPPPPPLSFFSPPLHRIPPLSLSSSSSPSRLLRRPSFLPRFLSFFLHPTLFISLHPRISFLSKLCDCSQVNLKFPAPYLDFDDIRHLNFNFIFMFSYVKSYEFSCVLDVLYMPHVLRNFHCH